jgi:hypothetical protein
LFLNIERCAIVDAAELFHFESSPFAHSRSRIAIVTAP